MRPKTSYGNTKSNGYLRKEIHEILNLLDLKSVDSKNILELCSVITDWFYVRKELVYLRLNNDFSDDELRCGSILAGIAIYERIGEDKLEMITNRNISRIAKFIMSYVMPSRMINVVH